jgi:hypothetical protein
VTRLGVAVLSLALLLAGCGNSEEAETPAACLAGPRAFQVALAAAPGEVRLAGDTAIGDCLIENQSAGELSQVGGSLVQVATELRAAAQGGRGAREAAVELGYLVAAVRGGAEHTGGIHAELARRVGSAAAVGGSQEPAAPSFDRAYARGYAGGEEHG